MTSSSVNPHEANRRGMEALARRDFASAAAAFADAVAADPQAGPLWRNLAHARRELGDSEGERQALEAALRIDRTDFMAWLRKAELHQRLNEHGEALLAWNGVLQMAARLDPVPPGLVPVLDQARAWIADRTRHIGSTVEAQLADSFAALDPGEQRRVRVFLDRALRGRRVYQNECAGLYYPFLPADEFFDEAHFPWFDALAQQTVAIRAELTALLADGDAALRPYVRLDEGSPHNKWSTLDHSLDWGACFLWEYGEPNPPVLERCPATAAALAAIPSAHIPGRSPSAFFSLLRPHTRIPPHTGVTNSRAIIHLPLIVPQGCGFRVGAETRPWIEGVPFAFDDTIEHEAWNDSDSLRAVLIFDVWNPHLSEAEQAMIVRYYAAADAAGMG
jgi:aspartyl/asparaginyl beta-hydroxylase (cupin superfamily)